MEEFRKLGLSETTLQALQKKGYLEPTEIQAKAIPLLLKGEKDVIGKSQTGTGKTASFGLPILEKVRKHSKNVQAIILTPTRELALQVADELNSLRNNTDIKILAVYGGSPIGHQIRKLKSGVDIVVGTPGRVMDLQNRKALKLDNIKFAVLDEADEMLNMGFVDDIESILKNTPKEKNMLLFSATMPSEILRIAKRYMKEYEMIEVEKTQVTTDTVEQIYYNIKASDRVEGLRRVIDYYSDFYGIIFCNTKATVDSLVRKLTKMEYNSAALHGDISQSHREKILQQFKNKNVKILVATDVAARGIDVNDLTHVVNFALPQTPESYVHRIGRTGRAGKKGISITFVIPSERRMLGMVEKTNNCKLEKRNIPTAQEIIQNKEDTVFEALKGIVKKAKGKESKFTKLADKLLEKYTATETVAAMLKMNFNDALNFNSYKDISEPTEAEINASRARSTGRGRGSRGRGSSRGRSSGRDRSSDRSRIGSSGRVRPSGRRSDRSSSKKTPQKSGKKWYDKKTSKPKKGGRR